MVDEARVGAHWKLTSPAGDPSCRMFRHVLQASSVRLCGRTCCKMILNRPKKGIETYDFEIALVVRDEATVMANEAVLQVDRELVLTTALLSALWTGDTKTAILIVLV
jgi:hypothetical protein